jgi:hypothetical protein
LRSIHISLSRKNYKQARDLVSAIRAILEILTDSLEVRDKVLKEIDRINMRNISNDMTLDSVSEISESSRPGGKRSRNESFAEKGKIKSNLGEDEYDGAKGRPMQGEL